MSDAVTTSAAKIVRDALCELRDAVAATAPDALNWKPAADETNSVAVLATHTMHSTRSWLSIALGAPMPKRDRPSEFLATADGVAELLALVDAMSADCNALLEGAGNVDWGAMRPTHARPNPGDPTEVPAAWALLHAVEHLHEHLGQMTLTNQLWAARSG